MQRFKDYAELYLQTAPLAYSTAGSYRASLTHYWLPALSELNVTEISYTDLLAIDSLIIWPFAQDPQECARATTRCVCAGLSRSRTARSKLTSAQNETRSASTAPARSVYARRTRRHHGLDVGQAAGFIFSNRVCDRYALR